MLGSIATRDGAGRRRRARGADAGRPTREVPVRAIDRGGALTTADGAIVRALELTPLGALAAGSELGEDVLDGVAELLGGLPPGEGVQWYAESRPAATAELAPPLPDPRALGPGLARALAEDAARIERQAAHPAGLERSLHLVVRTPPEGAARLARAGAAPGPLGAAHGRGLERSLARVERLSLALAELGLRPRLLDGPGMSRLLLRRLRGLPAQGGEPRVEVVGSLDERADAQRSLAAAARLLDLLRGVAVDHRDDRRVAVGAQLEQAIAVGAAPPDGARGWLAPLLDSEQRYAASIHVRARTDGRVDLAAATSLREDGPRPDAVRLATAVDEAVRAALATPGLRVDRGEFTQRRLWPATLPLGRDPEHAAHRVAPRVAAAALPLFADACGSPGGVPFGRGAHGRIERLDPWDLAHRQAAVLVAGGSARERAIAVLALAARLAGAGDAVHVLDGDGALADRCAALGGGPRFVVQDARDAPALLPLAGAAAARLAAAVDAAPSGAGARPATPSGADALLSGAAAPAGHERGEGEPALRAALALTGAERLLAEPGGAGWLVRAAADARRDGRCLLLAGPELRPFDAAGLLGVVPVRVLLAHPSRAAAALGDRLDLAPREVRALVRDGEPAPETPVALWCNGDRGRALVRLLELPTAATEEAA